MPKRIPIILICLVCLLFTSCATVSVVAPTGQKVMLASETEPTAFKTTKRVWYVLWGLVPITDNTTGDLISKYQLQNVRVQTQYDIVDWLIDVVLGWTSLHARTVTVEGNAGK
ncbi:MAG: hypothetical protein OEW70_04215 [candidate division WOR-3 bacterium]|nr:hypothetical protein [candidate division WOR-3 bacterium]